MKYLISFDRLRREVRRHSTSYYLLYCDCSHGRFCVLPGIEKRNLTRNIRRKVFDAGGKRSDD